MEEEVIISEEKKKKSNGKNIVIIILVVIIIGLVGFVAYDKNILGIKDKFVQKQTTEEKQEEKEQDTKEEELSLTDESFIGIYNYLRNYTYTEDRSNGYKSFSTKEFGQVAIQNVKEENLTKNEEKSIDGFPYYTFKANIIEDKLKEVFGPEIEFNKDDMIGISGLYTSGGFTIDSYNKETDTYGCKSYPIGFELGPSPKATIRVLTKAVKKNDTITLTERVIYLRSESTMEVGTYHIYSDKDLTNEIDTKTYDNTDWNNIESLVISVEDYPEKAGTIIYTFKLNKDTGKYYYVSSSIQ